MCRSERVTWEPRARDEDEYLTSNSSSSETGSSYFAGLLVLVIVGRMFILVFVPARSSLHHCEEW